MQNDPRFIFQASAQASKAVDHLLSYSRAPAEEMEEVVCLTVGWPGDAARGGWCWRAIAPCLFGPPSFPS